jgi:hypothetical protein
MRPRLGSAIADITAHATADPSRWTHRVGVTGRARDKTPSPGNAIDQASLNNARQDLERASTLAKQGNAPQRPRPDLLAFSPVLRGPRG